MSHNTAMQYSQRCRGQDGIDIDASFPPYLAEIAPFRTQLTGYQSRVLAAIIDTENVRIFTYTSGKTGSHKDYVPCIIYTDPVGSGKSFVIMALIIASPMPRPFAAYTAYAGNMAELTVPRGRIVRPNLLIVTKSTFSQWCAYLRHFTFLNVLTIAKCGDVPRFSAVTAGIDCFDVVLVRAGGTKVSVGTVTFTNMLSAIEHLSAEVCWSRVIYDDYDIVGEASRGASFNTLSTLFVSSTAMSAEHGVMSDWQVSVATFGKSPRINGILACDKVSIWCDRDYISSSMNLPEIIVTEYGIARNGSGFIKLLGQLGTQSADTVFEMLNGDALASVADLLGITAATPATVLGKVLGEHLDKYAAAKKRADETSDPAALAECLYYRRAIDKVKAGIAESDCQVCQLPLTGEAKCINRCCGMLTCSVCSIAGNRMKMVDATSAGSCANCASTIRASDLIVIGAEFGIAEILAALDGTTSEPERRKTKISTAIDILRGAASGRRTPATAIFGGTSVIEVGRGIVHEPAGIRRKTIVFASHNETLDLLNEASSAIDAAVFRLSGSYEEIARVARNFDKSQVDAVLLVNSRQNCAGLNLHMATDLIVMHKFCNSGMLEQVCGRAQRHGREFSLRLHLLSYCGE